MISLNVTITKNSIELDFHGRREHFEDFERLWDFCLLTAANKGIFKIKMVHGRGRDSDGLAYIDESIRNRLKNLRGVRWFRPDEGKLGVTLIYLSRNRSNRSRQKSNNQQLVRLAKELKENELLAAPQASKREFDNHLLKTTLHSLEFNWDENLVLETARKLMQSGAHEGLQRLLSEIQIFEIFYTDEFRSELNQIIDDMDQL